MLLLKRPRVLADVTEERRRHQTLADLKSEEGLSEMITVKSTQKIFTEDEISRLTGICPEHLRDVARSKHLGSLVRAAGVAGGQSERWLFSNTDLSVLTALQPRCEH
jgi:hypothetical protein